MNAFNELFAIVAVLANYVSFGYLWLYKREPGSRRKRHLRVLAFIVGCFFVMAGTYVLRCFIDGEGFNALLYALVSLVLCQDIVEHKGNISHAVRGVGHGRYSS